MTKIPYFLGLTLVLVFSSCSSLPKALSEKPVSEKAKAANDFSTLGDNNVRDKNYTVAEENYLKSLDINHSIDNLSGIAASNNSLGNLYLTVGKLDDAAKVYKNALAAAEADKSLALVARANINLGRLAIENGDLEAATKFFDTASLGLTNKERNIQAIILHNRGLLALAKNDLSLAKKFFEDAQKINKKLKTIRELASNHYMLARIYALENKYADAIKELELALDNDKKVEHSPGIIEDLWALYRMHSKNGTEDLAYDYLRRHFMTSVAANDAQAAKTSLALLVSEAERLIKEDDKILWKRYTEALGK